MSEETTLENLDQALKGETPSQPNEDVVEATPSTPAEPQIDAQGRSYATGKRKNAIARVWIKPGAGRITVNGKGEDVEHRCGGRQLAVAVATIVKAEDQHAHCGNIDHKPGKKLRDRSDQFKHFEGLSILHWIGRSGGRCYKTVMLMSHSTAARVRPRSAQLSD